MYFKRYLRPQNLNKLLNRFINTEIVIKSKSKIVVAPKLIEDYLWEGLDKWHDKAAIVCIDTGRTLTYGEMYKKSRTLAYNLKNLGLNVRDTVAIILPNIPEYPLVLLGSIQAGFRLTTINPFYTADEIASQLKDSDSKLVFTTTQLLGRVEKALLILKRKIPVVLTDQNNINGAIKLKDLLLNIDAINYKEKLHDLTPDDVILLPYSSGTTGVSKGVQLTHRNVVSNLSQMSSKDFAVLRERSEQQVIPVFLPLFHVYGMIALFFNFFSQGCKLVTFPKFGAHSFLKFLRDFRPNLTFAVPPLIRLFLNSPRIKTEILQSIDTIISAAAPLGVGDIERFIEKTKGKIEFLQMYGMTETSPLTLMQTRHLKDGVKLGGSGFLLPNTECKIIPIDGGDDLNGMGPNKNGELLIRGPQVMNKGYLNNPEATERVILPGGWLRTGDIGYYDEDEHFFITDRLKEMIKVKGFQVAPAEIEEVLRSHPLVEDCAVVGVPFKDKGEAPRAFVVLRQGMRINGQVLVDFVAKKVSSYKKLTGGVIVVDSIPKTPAGKVLRRQLKKL